MKAKAIKPFKSLPKEYAALCRWPLPRPMHDAAAYGDTLKIVEAFAGFEDAMNVDQRDYFDLLTDLVGEYEDKTLAAAAPPTVEARLKYLLDQAGWSGAEFGRFLDLDGTMGNKILRGERKLTVEHVKKLAAAFHLSPSYFIA